VGRIDILAVDAQGGLLVIELKVSRGPDAVCGQLLRYKGWVKRHLAQGWRVRGLIIAQHISDRIRYALADDPEVSLKEYVLNISLKDVPQLDPPGDGKKG
jgi:endonuclease